MCVATETPPPPVRKSDPQTGFWGTTLLAQISHAKQHALQCGCGCFLKKDGVSWCRLRKKLLQTLKPGLRWGCLSLCVLNEPGGFVFGHLSVKRSGRRNYGEAQSQLHETHVR